MKQVFTIGYEGTTPDELVQTLKHHKINILLDVRELPLSRKKGFSKNALHTLLQSNQITYQHEKKLGAPKPIRHRLREDKNYTAYFNAFSQYIETQNELLNTLATHIKDNVVLLCYEKDYKICHRLVVANKLAAILNIQAKHLEIIKHAKSKTTHQSIHLSQSLPSI